MNKTFNIILLIFLLAIYLEIMKINIVLKESFDKINNNQSLLYKSILADGYIASGNDSWIKNSSNGEVKKIEQRKQ